MARGLQKEQARAKAQAKLNTGGKSSLKEREKPKKFPCPKCLTPINDYPTFKMHFEAKHPKDPLPTAESFEK